MYLKKRYTGKNRSKMSLSRTRKKVSDYFIYIIVIASIIQLIILIFRLTQL